MPFAALIPIAISAASAIGGYLSKRKAQKERERLAASRPEIGDSEFVDEQIDLARSELARGNNTASRLAYEEAADTGFASSLDAILRGGGNVNNVADLYGNSMQGRMRLAMMDDDLRIQRIRNLSAAQQGAEGFRQQQFQFNQFAPWADNAQAAAQAYAGANQQMWSGIANVGAGLTNYASMLQQEKMYDKYLASLGGRGGNSVSVAPPQQPAFMPQQSYVSTQPVMYSNTGMASQAPTTLSNFDWSNIRR